MLFRLTNGGGMHAPGLVVMWRAVIKLGDAHVVAPEAAPTASGHGITITTPLLTSPVTVENAFSGIAVDGRPADCVKVAVAKLLPRQPDLVVSGINSGANTGINVTYSGTIAAAIEAAFLGLPAIAASLYLRRDVPLDYARAAVQSRQTIEMILQAGLPPGRIATINLPALAPGGVPTGVKIVRQCIRAWADTYEER